FSLIRDEWPNAVARLAQDEKEFEDMTFDETVPQSFEAICEWGYLHHMANNRDMARGFVLLYRPTDPVFVKRDIRNSVEVNIRFQGFLGDHNLKPLGNWRGTPDTIHKAVQYLRLQSGPFPELMEGQVSCIENIKRFVFRHILDPEDAAAAIRAFDMVDDSISFQRRVFTKASGITNAGKTAPFHRFWRVTTKLDLGRKTAEGRAERCNHLLFSPGDFVDVTARVDIANIRSTGNVPSVKVFLAPLAVVQLCKQEEVAEVSVSHRIWGPLNLPDVAIGHGSGDVERFF
ncbi:hypothetical protein BV25DRAFT_1817153, partial [Artomyces pyxidatus]